MISPESGSKRNQGVGSTPDAPAISRAFPRGTVAPWTWPAALPPAFGQLTSSLGPEALSFPTRPLSIAVHSQARGPLRNFPQETESYWSCLLKLTQALVFPLHHLHCYQLSPSQGHLKHKSDYVTSQLSIPSVPAMVSQLTQ